MTDRPDSIEWPGRCALLLAEDGKRPLWEGEVGWMTLSLRLRIDGTYVARLRIDGTQEEGWGSTPEEAMSNCNRSARNLARQLCPDAFAVLERLQGLFDAVGEGQYNALALIDHFQEEERYERERRQEAEAIVRELQRNALPTDCMHCKGAGCLGHETEGPCDWCGGWTAHKRLLAAQVRAYREVSDE